MDLFQEFFMHNGMLVESHADGGTLILNVFVIEVHFLGHERSIVEGEKGGKRHGRNVFDNFVISEITELPDVINLLNHTLLYPLLDLSSILIQRCALWDDSCLIIFQLNIDSSELDFDFALTVGIERNFEICEGTFNREILLRFLSGCHKFSLSGEFYIGWADTEEFVLVQGQVEVEIVPGALGGLERYFEALYGAIAKVELAEFPVWDNLEEILILLVEDVLDHVAIETGSQWVLNHLGRMSGRTH